MRALGDFGFGAEASVAGCGTRASDSQLAVWVSKVRPQWNRASSGGALQKSLMRKNTC